MSNDQNLEIVKQGYAAFAAGDAATAMRDFDDSIEWTSAGNSAVSGTFHGKAEIGANWMQLAEKSVTTTPERFIVADDVVVVLTQVAAGEESGPEADVFTFRDGKIVTFQAFGDTAMMERVFGTKPTGGA